MTRQVRVVQPYGNHLKVVFNDGTSSIAYVGVSMWHGRDVSDGTNPPAGGGGGDAGVGRITEEMVLTAIQTYGSTAAAAVWSPGDIAANFSLAIKNLEPGAYQSKESRAAIVGECCVETDGFRTMEEYGHSSGDGNYWGRGMIQLTWSSNYAAFGQYMFGKGQTSAANIYLESPEIVANDGITACSAAIFYFQKVFGDRRLTEWCVQVNRDTPGNWDFISRAIVAGNPFGDFRNSSFDTRNTVINAVLGVTPESSAGGGPNPSDAGQRAANWMLDHVGQYGYSQTVARNIQPDSGAGDCSSTVVFAYVLSDGYTFQDFGGTGRYVPGDSSAGWPGYTGTLLQTGTFIQSNLDESNMQVGDLIIISYGSATGDHVEMYIGGGRTCGHGGGPDGITRGPTVNNISAWSNVAWVQVRRYAKG